MKKYFLFFTLTILVFALFPAVAMEAEELQFPKLSGLFSVGYKNFDFKDKSRKDPYNTWHSRRLKATVWYPSQNEPTLEPYGEEENKFWERELEKLKASDFKKSDLKAAMLEMQHLKVHKSFEAQPLHEKCPVLLFEHGIGVTAGSYQCIFQELVSHGYIVVATHHPYVADTVFFQAREKVDKVYRKAKRNKKTVDTCLEDISFILGALSRLEGLEDIMDLDNIGMLGHSLGGTLTMKTARDKSFIKAALQLDAPLGDEVAQQYDNGSDFTIPFCHIFAEESVKTLPSLSLKANNFKAVIKGTEHMSFADHLLLMEIVPTFRKFSDPDPDYLTKYYGFTTLIRSFFDRFLKNKGDFELMDLNDEGVRIETGE